jgi:hypothetical protein
MDTRHIRRTPPKPVDLYKLSRNQLHNHIMREPLPQALTEDILETFRQEQKRKPDTRIPSTLEEYHEIMINRRLALRDKILADKNAQRIDKIKRKHHTKLWRELMSSLKYEMTNARVGMKYKSVHPTPERDIAFTKYLEVMEKTMTRLEGLQAHDLTPSQTAQLLAREHGIDIPNNGSHWTDWVQPSKRREVNALFEAIPTMPRTKRKLPFQRTQRPTAPTRGMAKLERLKQRTQKELELVQREFAVAPTDKRRETIGKIKHALRWMDDMKPNEFVPPTWHGLYPENTD